MARLASHPIDCSLKGTLMSVETIGELLLDELKDLYSAEKQITKSLPKLAKAATSPELKQAFQSHLEETKRQIALRFNR
jgi:ferritin-like metal-binding protein YciE